MQREERDMQREGRDIQRAKGGGGGDWMLL